MLELIYRLNGTRHSVDFASRSLRCLDMDVKKVARYVERNPADAWVIFGGSKDILRWFSEQPFASMALFGRMSGLPIAGVKPHKAPAERTAVQHLVKQGHRRIVKLVLEERVYPTPGLLEQSFLDELELNGILTGSYNLCAWTGEPDNLYERLDALFRHSPPTALFCDINSVFYATRDYLSRRGILAPEHISLIACDPDPPYLWVKPSVAHIDWSFQPIIKRVVRWLENVASGKEDKNQTFAKATFVDGGTVGPVNTEKRPI
jgi:DNA-binding LacI/PurR family transcriptional regulator